MLVFVLLLFGAAILAVIIAGDSLFLTMVLTIVFFAVFICVLYKILNFKSPSKKANESKLNFYKECITKGISDLSTEANHKKAELIAQKLKCSDYTNLEEYFKQGKQLYESQNRRIQEENLNAELRAIRDEEQKKYDSLTKYGSYFGREKRITMLSDQVAEYEKQIADLRFKIEHYKRSSQEKEIDWASHGGFAAGLAGGAAGAAVAMDAQIKNVEIRAQNKARLEALMPFLMALQNEISDYERKAEEAKTAIEEAKIKLVADNSSMDSVLSRLSFEAIQVKPSKTGAVEVKADVQLKTPFTIFDVVPAVVDGSVSADLYQYGKKVGNALLVLPALGIGQAATVEGICLPDAQVGAKEGVPYEVKFTAHNLWEMEA